jgi:peptidoglycan/LPS O-acetylase OafA/YrhL
MTSRILRLLPILVATTLACCSLSAQAIPKVAEHEDAPVTNGADVLRPKPISLYTTPNA